MLEQPNALLARFTSNDGDDDEPCRDRRLSRRTRPVRRWFFDWKRTVPSCERCTVEWPAHLYKKDAANQVELYLVPRSNLRTNFASRTNWKMKIRTFPLVKAISSTFSDLLSTQSIDFHRIIIHVRLIVQAQTLVHHVQQDVDHEEVQW